MIKADNLTKTFGDIRAINKLNCQIQRGSIYGLVGSNGAGKSTFLRLVAGILRHDEGNLLIEDQQVFENPLIKSRMFFIADQQHFEFPTNIDDLVDFYRFCYPRFSRDLFDHLAKTFPIQVNKNLGQMSKGMLRQLILMLGFACQPDYLLLDEVFDGLDPVIRQLLKQLLADSVASHNQTIVIASHNLRELEDIIDHVGILHQGSIIKEQNLDELKLGYSKIQIAFDSPMSRDDLSDLDVLHFKSYGRITELVVRGQYSELMDRIKKYNPAFVESLPLTFEEVFIQEMEVVGYDIKKLID